MSLLLNNLCVLYSIELSFFSCWYSCKSCASRTSCLRSSSSWSSLWLWCLKDDNVWLLDEDDWYFLAVRFFLGVKFSSEGPVTHGFILTPDCWSTHGREGTTVTSCFGKRNTEINTYDKHYAQWWTHPKWRQRPKEPPSTTTCFLLI